MRAGLQHRDYAVAVARSRRVGRRGSAPSEPRPVSERTSSSSYVRASSRVLESIVPSQHPRKPIGIVTRPGNVSDDGEP